VTSQPAPLRCPRCRKPIPAGSERCLSCGLVVQGLATEVVAANGTTKAADEIECPYCAEKIKRKAIKCKHCGSNLTESAYKTSPTNAPRGFSIQSTTPRNRGIYNSARSRHARPLQRDRPKSRVLYLILALFFGVFGTHNFYAGYYGKGAAQLITSCLFPIGFLILAFPGGAEHAGHGNGVPDWTVIGFFITGVWAFIDMFVVTVDAKGVGMK